MKLSNKQLRQIINEELTKILQESDLPDFIKRKKSYDFEMPDFTKKKKSDMPDFTKKKAPVSDMPDFKKRPKKTKSIPEILKDEYGIHESAMRHVISKIIEKYYIIRTGGMVTRMGDSSKVDSGREPTNKDEKFIQLVSKLPGADKYMKILQWLITKALPFDEWDYNDIRGKELYGATAKEVDDRGKIAWVIIGDGSRIRLGIFD